MKVFIHTLLLVLLNSVNFIFAQTAIVYSEDFNSGPGGWIIGGDSPSWKYGVPSLPDIIPNGSNCFVTGDAGASAAEPFSTCPAFTGPTTTGNFYNCCEHSYVESPSIDLTAVSSPLLSIDINVFCEQTFDGAKIQISIDGGISWTDVGTHNGPGYLTFPHEKNCREKNWYNKDYINYLDPTAGCPSVSNPFGGSRAGWSGGCSQGSSGSCSGPDNHGTNGWITATQCLSAAANQPDVKIRVEFGAGNRVYADGIAFDNVIIYDSHPDIGFNTAPLSACDYTIGFNNTTDCGASWSWDFGDPGSSGNTSTSMNPVHTFSDSGTYVINFIAYDFCGGATQIFQNITVDPVTPLSINNINVADPLLCDSSSGAVSLQLNQPGIDPYTVNYLYNNSPVSLSGLTGNPVVLNDLSPGDYSGFTITDSQGCADEKDTTFTIPYIDDGLFIDAFPDTTVLPGNPVTLHVSANIPSVFAWNPVESLDNPNAADPVALPLTTTTYNVLATDTNGCISLAELTVIVDDTRPCNQYYFPNSFTPNKDNKNENFGVVISPLMNLAEYELSIYDRWGNQVFNSNDTAELWDGNDAPEGTYLIVAEFKCVNKKTSKYSGVLSLIR